MIALLLSLLLSHANAANLKSANALVIKFAKCPDQKCRSALISKRINRFEAAAFSQWLAVRTRKLRLRPCERGETERADTPSAPDLPFFCHDVPGRLTTEFGMVFIDPTENGYRFFKSITLFKNLKL